MKQLLIIRHAKAKDLEFNQHDFDRPLRKNGMLEALEIASFLKEQKIIIQKCYVSPAKRTTETAKVITSVLDIPTEDIHFEPALYDASTQDLLFTIQKADNQAQSIALVGHNPAISDLISYFLPHQFTNLATCEAVLFKLPIEHWQEIRQGAGEVILRKKPTEN